VPNPFGLVTDGLRSTNESKASKRLRDVPKRSLDEISIDELLNPVDRLSQVVPFIGKLADSLRHRYLCRDLGRASQEGQESLD